MKSVFALIAVLAGLAFVACAPKAPQALAASEPLVARVTRISEEYANINTDLSGKRLAAHGIGLGTSFALRYKDRSLNVLLGEDYGEVAKGEWIGLIEEDGNLQAAVSFGNAATELGVAVGDTLYIAPLGPK